MLHLQETKTKPATLILEDGSFFVGHSFGADVEVSGEVVFTTGMTGYPESFTDPSYEGQILVLTYPLIGNYGVPTAITLGSPLETGASSLNQKEISALQDLRKLISTITGRSSTRQDVFSKKIPRHVRESLPQRVLNSIEILTHPFESDKIHIRGLVVTDYSRNPYHWNSKSTLSQWLKDEGIPAIAGIDTRELTKKLREKGTMLGRIVKGLPKKEHFLIPFEDPNRRNLVSEVSIEEKKEYAPLSEVLASLQKFIAKDSYDDQLKSAAGSYVTSRANRKFPRSKTIALIDCGTKNNIIRELIIRDVHLIRVPWDYDFSDIINSVDGVVISNGPGDPKLATNTINTASLILKKRKPVFGICLGNQILSLAAGGKTYKLKYGHRAQNQPCIEVGTKRCYITSQNHGFAVDSSSLPKDWEVWFVNANDGTNEGVKHRKLPALSVQFHPEAMPGPTDTSFLFDKFISMIDR